jgi:hypothetical protein
VSNEPEGRHQDFSGRRGGRYRSRTLDNSRGVRHEYETQYRCSMLSVGLFLALSASQAGVETTQASKGATVTEIKVNGRRADMFLINTNTGTTGS